MGRDTAEINYAKITQLISTHTPAWGATSVVDRANSGEFISTHTPAWGATI